MKTKRQSTVEPVLGTLTQFMGLRKINTRGIENANKCRHMSAVAYNLKKILKFEQMRIKTVAMYATLILQLKTREMGAKRSLFTISISLN